LALLLALPASGQAEVSWLAAEVRAQEARWAAQRDRAAGAVERPAPTRGEAVRRRAMRAQTRSFPPAVARSAPTRPAEAGDLAQTILTRARQHRLDPLLVKAVILTESAGRPRARSPKGAMGLMQLMPVTARRFGVTDPYDAAQNVAGGTRYLRWLLDRFGGDVPRALAGYNAGEGAVERYGGIPPYRETRNYVTTVQTNYRVLSRRVADQLAQTASK
jgi:soluble lytic murein transglycosylase-like protein